MTSPEGPLILAERLNSLFRKSRPEGRQWTNDEVAAKIRETRPGVRVSGAYLSALRTGKRTSPSSELLTALANFFGVSAAYFFDSQYSDRVDTQLAVLEQLQQTEVKGIAMRAAGLSADSLQTVKAVLDEIRRLQGLPAVED
ncbi:helix-turn-helix transcriptional regulator [Streptomyces atriruber]|uniref:helix-turn-helix transcriptional regulator n=1 Tax=Streptomyces atriruber TaxID=545121 RepID=UPI0006E12FFB|nr:helix-turn-helix transcriptional regulator [Streptomyces atriruber]